MSDEPNDNQTAGDNTDKEYEVVVDGESRKVGIDELVRGYGHEASANKRYREADDMRKAAEQKSGEAATALQVQSDMMAIKDGDQEAFKRLAQHQGWSEDEIDKAMAQVAKASGTQQTQVPSDNGNEDPIKLLPEHMPVEWQKFFGHFAERGISPAQLLEQVAGHARDNLDAQDSQKINAALDNDPKLRLYFDSKSDPDGKARKAITARITNRVSDKETLDQAMQTVLDDQRSLVEHVEKTAVQRFDMHGLGPSSGHSPMSLHPAEEPPVFDEKLAKTDHKAATAQLFNRLIQHGQAKERMRD